MINKIRLLGAAVLAGAAFAAQAQSADDRAPTNWRFGVQLGSVKDRGQTDPAVQISMGYDINRYFSVEALGNLSLLFIREGSGLTEGEHEFDQAFGVRALGTLPLGDRWSLVGGVGVVQFEDEVGTGTGLFGDTRRQSKASPMVSLASTWRIGRRWSLGVEASSFTQAHTTNVGLRGEFHF
jgi:hypothetical protein